MKLHEALSKSNKVKRKLWMEWSYFDYTTGVVHAIDGNDTRLYIGDYQADDWEPILEKKKTLKSQLEYLSALITRSRKRLRNIQRMQIKHNLNFSYKL